MILKHSQSGRKVTNEFALLTQLLLDEWSFSRLQNLKLQCTKMPLVLCLHPMKALWHKQSSCRTFPPQNWQSFLLSYIQKLPYSTSFVTSWSTFLCSCPVIPKVFSNCCKDFPAIPLQLTDWSSLSWINTLLRAQQAFNINLWSHQYHSIRVSITVMEKLNLACCIL